MRFSRAIPSTGERLPAVGLGTASVFDRDDSEHAAAQPMSFRLVAGVVGLIDTGSTHDRERAGAVCRT
jgi:hypothetical protein